MGMGVVCTSPGSGGVFSGCTGSGGGTSGLVAIPTSPFFLFLRLAGKAADHGFALFIFPIGR
jgi:hypothetical protein